MKLFNLIFILSGDLYRYFYLFKDRVTHKTRYKFFENTEESNAPPVAEKVFLHLCHISFILSPLFFLLISLHLILLVAFLKGLCHEQLSEVL